MSDVTARTLPSPAPARKALRDGLRVVRPAEPSLRTRRRRAQLAAAALIALVAAGLFGLVALHVLLTQNQFRLDGLRSQAATEEAKYQRLRLEVAQLESPPRIVADAQQRLGMVQPPSVTYLTPVSPATPPPSAGARDPKAVAAGSDPTGWTEVKPRLAPGR